MTKLTDTQLVVLSAASQRENRLVLPLPKTLRGGAAQRSIESLLAKGLVEEVDANRLNGDPVWRDSGDGGSLTLLLTDAGLAALDGDTLPREANAAKSEHQAGKAENGAPAGRKAKSRISKADRKAPVRECTKQAKMIDLLKRPRGATIAELAETLGWQAHTVRGALAGVLKKRLGLAVTSEPDEKRGRVYRVG